MPRLHAVGDHTLTLGATPQPCCDAKGAPGCTQSAHVRVKECPRPLWRRVQGGLGCIGQPAPRPTEHREKVLSRKSGFAKVRVICGYGMHDPTSTRPVSNVHGFYQSNFARILNATHCCDSASGHGGRPKRMVPSSWMCTVLSSSAHVSSHHEGHRRTTSTGWWRSFSMISIDSFISNASRH